MKITTLLSIAILFSLTNIHASDTNSDLIQMAKIYRDFMFRNSPTTHTYEQLAAIENPQLKVTSEFIKEVITSNNKLTTEAFLRLPDKVSLKYIYIIRKLRANFSEEFPIDAKELVSILQVKEVLRYELIDNYYDMLVTGIGNKNQPFNLQQTDFEISKYGLTDETEEGIFFLKIADLCGTSIWGYMNIVKPANYKEAKKYIDKFPTFNGQPYYQYKDFGFEDFEMEILKDKDLQSYKAYYINKYYNLLISHLACLNQKKKYKDQAFDLALGSILSSKNYYKYSEKSEYLETLFRTVKK